MSHFKYIINILISINKHKLESIYLKKKKKRISIPTANLTVPNFIALLPVL